MPSTSSLEIVSVPVFSVLSSPRALQQDTQAGKFPVTIASLLQQAGGFRFGGALMLVGCCASKLSELLFRHPANSYDYETRGNTARWNHDAQKLDFTVGIEFPVNGKRGQDWRMAVSYDADDTYSIWIWAQKSVEDIPELLDSRENVYGDELLRGIDTLYTEAMNRFNDGFIPLD